ncbi:MAG: nuclear transport factor 2 family protein [Cyclobacteriaceae bacterium]
MKLFLNFVLSFLMINTFAFGSISEKDSTYIKIVQTQLKAYNNKDIDLFLSQYKDSVKVFRYPRILLYKGKDEMRKNYEALFRDASDLHCSILNRTVLGNTVIDHERVLQFKDSSPFEAIAIYRIWDGLIEEVTFLFKNQP